MEKILTKKLGGNTKEHLIWIAKVNTMVYSFFRELRQRLN